MTVEDERAQLEKKLYWQIEDLHNKHFQEVRRLYERYYMQLKSLHDKLAEPRDQPEAQPFQHVIRS